MATTIRDLARLLADMDTDERLATFRHTGAWYGIVTILDYLVARDGMNVDVDTMAGQGTPTPIETHPGPSEKDTLMERSIDKDEEEHTPSLLEKISELGGASWSLEEWERFFEVTGPKMPATFREFIEGAKNTPHVQKKNSALSDFDLNWICGGGLDDVADVFRSGSPKKNSEIRADPWPDFNRNNYGLGSQYYPVSRIETSGSGRGRLGAVLPALKEDPDNGPDGAFGPDVAEVERKSATQIRMASVMIDFERALTACSDERGRVPCEVAHEILGDRLRRSGLL